ncbi:MAG: SbtA family thio(seleno)oxazole RiPP natural product precursor [Thermodesulfobacteriota bacterium]
MDKESMKKLLAGVCFATLLSGPGVNMAWSSGS